MLLLVTAAFLVLSLLWIGRLILLLFFAAVLVALLLSTAADWLSPRLRIPRGAALLSVLLGGVGILALAIWLRGAAIADELVKLETDLPLAVHKLLAQVNATAWGHWLLPRLSEHGKWTSGFAFAASRIGVAMLSAATLVGALIIIAMAGVYFAIEPDTYLDGLRLLTPARYQPVVDHCLTLAAAQLRWWLLAKLLSMVAVGLLVSIGLWILDVPLAGTLGIIAAALTFIPNLGPILSAVPAALLAFAISPSRGLLTIALFFAVHFIEGNFVTPFAERQIVKLPPALTLAVQLLLAATTGAFGIALAAPLTAALIGIAHVFVPAPAPQPSAQTPSPQRSLKPVASMRAIL